MSNALYYPCLQWKQGEYQALLRLNPATRARIVPIIEIPDIGWDFEKGALLKTLQDHLSCQPERFIKKWPDLPFYLDCDSLMKYGLFQKGKTSLRWLLEQLCNQNQKPIPVFRPGSLDPLLDSCRWHYSNNEHKLSLRISAFSIPTQRNLDQILEKVGAAPENIDLIFDYGAPCFDQKDSLKEFLIYLINDFPYIQSWNRLILLGCSFPQSMGSCPQGISLMPREDWSIWKTIVENDSCLRNPEFADYCISHPDIPQGDLRLLKPSASIRYTCDDFWTIVKGTSFRKNREQYRKLCGDLLSSTYYQTFPTSAGSQYIQNCASGKVGTGNLSTWRWVGTNHHIEKLVADLSSLSWHRQI